MTRDHLYQTLLTSLCLLFAAGTAAQTPDAEAAAVKSVARSFHEALRAGDAAAIERLLAADAVILENGEVESREEYLRHHLAADIEFAKAVPSRSTATEVTLSGNTAWLRAKSITQGQYRDQAVRLAGAELMVLTRREASWQIRAIHWSSRKLK